MTAPTPDSRTLYVLRSCNPDRTSHGGFQYPETGPVQAPDYDPDPDRECGGGLHGLLYGQGEISLTDPEGLDRLWQVLAVDPEDCANPDPALPKVRFRQAEVLLTTPDPAEAAAFLLPLCPPGTPPLPFLRSYDLRNAVTGPYGTATAGDGGTATAGTGGTATAGYRGTATAGYGGTATAGYRGTATAGDDGTAAAGTGGEIRIRYYSNGRLRTVIGYPGEAGILPDTPYRATPDGKLVPA